MKKSHLLGTAFIALATASVLFAQTTTGSSLIDKMKAASHAFTLTTDLNGTQTGLTSEPVKGKKTGDILTAGEYNRLLELVSSGGSGTGGLQITFKKDYSKDGNSSVPTTENIGSHDFCALTRYGEGALSDSTAGYCKVEKGTNGIWTVSIQALNNNINCQVTCFTGSGGTASSGGSAQIVEGGIIKTSAKTISNWDLITLEGSWNSGGGDAAPTGGYIYKLNGQAKLAYVEASGISKDVALTTTAQNVHNLTVKLSGESVVIDPSTTNTLAYIVWKFTGGSGSVSSSCPSGFVAIGSYCIEPTMNSTNKDWYEAAVACTEKGAQLCHWSEWSAACQKGILTDVVFGGSGKYEWIDDYSIANQGIADPIVYSNCKYLSRQADTTKASNTGYRCCAPKK